MNKGTVIHVLGNLLVLLAVILLVPAGISWADGGPDLQAFKESIAATLLAGIVLNLATAGAPMAFTRKEGFGVVAFGWIVVVGFSCLPFCLAEIRGLPEISFTDAYFEAMSGFTTTGASVLPDVEVLPRGLLFWRSFTHWLGGMGIVVLSLAVLPALGAGGFQLFRAEVPGPSKDKLTPSITSTAKAFYGVYLGISLLMFLCLLPCGMGWFDAACHTFASVGTGGFSTKNASIAFFNDWRVDLVATVFCFLCGCNFMLYLNALRGDPGCFWRSSEFRLYVLIVAASITVMTAVNHLSVLPGSETLPHTLRRTAAQAVSIMSTTGFYFDDYDAWPLFCQLILVGLMFVGCCAGSTAGGFKVFRLLILLKTALRETRSLLLPRAVLPVKADGRSLGEDLVRSILGFTCLYLLTFAAFSLAIVCLEGHRYDLSSLLSACVSCLGNVGPGLGSLGPTDNYSQLGDAAKWCLTLLMLLGRLELYSLLVVLHIDFWRR